MKVFALIPARGGSKRIPNKNILPFCGKPIISYSIQTAIECGIFDDVIVSTDSTKIASIAKQYGANIPFLRSDRLSDDFSTTMEVLKDSVEKIGAKRDDLLCCIYPTAPLLGPKTLIEAYILLMESSFEYVFCATKYSYPPQRGFFIKEKKIKMPSPQYISTRSQDLEELYHDAGMFYFCRVGAIMDNLPIFGERSYAIVLPQNKVQDIDNLTDWAIAEMKYKLL